MAFNVDLIFNIAFATVLVSGLAISFLFLFPYLGNEAACINGQKENVIELNEIVKNVRLTGGSQVIKFHVENCVDCLWYENGDIKIKWDGKDNPTSIHVEASATWEGFGSAPVDDLCNGINGGKRCTLELTSYPYRVRVVGDC
jgi:hypothetical protein